MGGIDKAIEGGAADAKEACGADLVTVDAGEDPGDMAEDGLIEIWVVGGEVGGGGSGGGPLKAGDVDGANPLAGTFEGGGGDDGLELTDIARPGIIGQAAEGAGSKSSKRLAVLEAPLPEKEAGEEGEVVASVAERGQPEADGGEMAGEIEAKCARGGEAAQGLGGADDDLERAGDGEVPEALMGGSLKELAEKALLGA